MMLAKAPRASRAVTTTAFRAFSSSGDAGSKKSLLTHEEGEKNTKFCRPGFLSLKQPGDLLTHIQVECREGASA